jgi:TonB family protein
MALLCSSTLAFAEDPEALDRASISKAMAAVKADVQACGKASTAKGSVKVSVKVLPSGEIEKAEAKAAPEAALGDCVVAAVKKATFPKTKQGGSFTYPFVF